MPERPDRYSNKDPLISPAVDAGVFIVAFGFYVGISLGREVAEFTGSLINKTLTHKPRIGSDRFTKSDVVTRLRERPPVT